MLLLTGSSLPECLDFKFGKLISAKTGASENGGWASNLALWLFRRLLPERLAGEASGWCLRLLWGGWAKWAVLRL